MMCPCCRGSGEVPDEPPAGFTRLERKIWNAILQHDGISSEALAARVYAECPDGGPLYARNTVVRTVHTMKKKMAGFGFSIQSKRGAPGYRIRKIRSPDAATFLLKPTEIRQCTERSEECT